MSVTRKLFATTVAAGAAVGLTLGILAPASAQTINVPIGVTSCGGTGQVCAVVPQIDVTTAGPLRVQFTASSTLCSKLVARIMVDGVPRGSTFLTPGQSTTPMRTFVASGVHKVGVQAVGVSGGCNTGHLTSWKGDVNVQTDLDALMAS